MSRIQARALAAPFFVWRDIFNWTQSVQKHTRGQMEILPEIVGVILNYVGDTRRYACTSWSAVEHCSRRPDHVVWQRIRSLNDYFTCGTAEIVTRALTDVPALAALGSDGLVCALANAVRADNVEVVAAMIPRVPADKLYLAAMYCSEKTYKLFDVNWREFHMKYCRCPRELGFTFSNIGTECCHDIISNQALSDEYLVGMLDENDWNINFVLECAYKYNRAELAFAAVTRTDRLSCLRNTQHGHFRLAKKLASLLPQTAELAELLEQTRLSAISCGLVDELDAPDDVVAAMNILSAAHGKGDPALLRDMELLLYDTMARYCSDHDILAASPTYGVLIISLIRHGRVTCLRAILGQQIASYLSHFRAYVVHHRDSIVLAKSLGVKLECNFADTTVDLYVAAKN